MINSSQIQHIYHMGAKLGLLDNDNHKDDLLHVLVYGLTGKESIKKLNNAECKIVTDELSKRMKQLQISQQKHKTKKYEDTAKGMTAQQQRKVWALMYQLVELDLKPQTATIGKRLCGIIKKEMPKGLNRTEVFADCGTLEAAETDEAISLEEEAKHKLLDYKSQESMTAENNLSGSFIYGKDFDLGDLVTVLDRTVNKIEDKRITEVEECYEAKSISINLTFETAEHLNRVIKAFLPTVK